MLNEAWVLTFGFYCVYPAVEFGQGFSERKTYRRGASPNFFTGHNPAVFASNQ
jgi:hypothetical protein